MNTFVARWKALTFSWREPENTSVKIKIVHDSGLGELIFYKFNFRNVGHLHHLPVDAAAEVQSILKAYLILSVIAYVV